MIIIGQPWIPSPVFIKVAIKEDITKVNTQTIVVLASLEVSHSLAEYCQKNAIAYAVQVQRIEDALYANALNARYIICEENLAKEIQSIANEYLFDTRVLVEIQNEKEILAIAKLGIDGVIYKDKIG